jgi:cysteine-S-conjugate beta-lyase
MTYNFDEIIIREGTDCVKYDLRKQMFGTEDLIPLWVADMDFRAPREVEEALKARAAHPIYGYTLQTDEFFGSAREWLDKKFGWKPAREAMSHVPGVVPALSLLINTFTEVGDKVIIQPPVYFPFYKVIEGNNREVLKNPLKLEKGRYEMDFEDLENKIDERTRMILLCNPHNPGGRMWSREELQKLSDICARHNILIIADEIHMDLSLCGKTHIPMASVSEQAAAQTITCISPAKTFNVAGLGSAITIVENPELRTIYKHNLETSHLFIGNIFGTVGLTAAYRYGDEWLGQLLPYLRENMEFIDCFLKERIPQIKLIRPEATFLAFLDCRELGLDDDALFEFMCEQAKVGMNRGSMFGDEGKGFMRLNFATPRARLQQALEQIEQAVIELRITN